MRSEDLEQVKAIIENLDKTNKKVPFFQDLQTHPVYGQFFRDLDNEDIKQIQ